MHGLDPRYVTGAVEMGRHRRLDERGELFGVAIVGVRMRLEIAKDLVNEGTWHFAPSLGLLTKVGEETRMVGVVRASLIGKGVEADSRGAGGLILGHARVKMPVRARACVCA